LSQQTKWHSQRTLLRPNDVVFQVGIKVEGLLFTENKNNGGIRS